ncbi:MAG: beta-propeller fold lactonase family protein [Chloroflexi bacterium]|nr:beta-propeller fold lactonase family protein [Chloroflexota bacterium]
MNTDRRGGRRWGYALLSIVAALVVVLAGCQSEQPKQSPGGVPSTGVSQNGGGGPFYVAQQMKDPWYGFASGGVSGAMVVIGIPSMRILKMIPVGVDLHEPVFSGSNAGGTNGTPDGKFVYINDLADNTIGEIDLSTFETVRKIKLPDPFGPHHIAITPDGKTLYASGEYTGELARIDIASGKVDVIDISEKKDSAPDYLTVTKDGKYVLTTDYYRSGVAVVDAASFKMVKFIPAGKNPHGIDITPDGKYAFVAGKLSANSPVIDTSTLEVVKEIPTGGGPLHTVFSPDGKYAYQTLFVDNAIVKIDIAKMQVIDKYPVRYRPGHLQITPDGRYVVSLNKWSTDLFNGVGSLNPNQDPVNFELIDTQTGKTVSQVPIPPEPHNMKIIAADIIDKQMKGLKPPKEGLVSTGGEPLQGPPNRDQNTIIKIVPKDTAQPGIEKDGDVTVVHMQAFSFGFKPDPVRVKKGDRVRLIITNVDERVGMTNDPAPAHGLIINSLGLKTNVVLPPAPQTGVSTLVEFTADKAGTFEVFCGNFCGPLHLEMRSKFIVEDGSATSASAPATTSAVAPAVPAGQAVFAANCATCHGKNAEGLVGPDLRKIGASRDAGFLTRWLADPASVKPTTTMPKVPLAERDLKELVEYLLTLR